MAEQNFLKNKFGDKGSDRIGFLYSKGGNPEYAMVSANVDLGNRSIPFYLGSQRKIYQNLSKVIESNFPPSTKKKSTSSPGPSITKSANDLVESRDPFDKYYELIKEIDNKIFNENIIASKNKIPNFEKKYSEIISFYNNLEELSWLFFSELTPFTFPQNLLLVIRNATEGGFEICGTISVAKKTTNNSSPSPQVKSHKEQITQETLPKKANYDVVFHVDKTHSCTNEFLNYNRAIHFHTHPMNRQDHESNCMDKVTREIEEILNPPSIQDLSMSVGRLLSYYNDILFVFTNGGFYLFKKRKLTMLPDSEKYWNNISKLIDEFKTQIKGLNPHTLDEKEDKKQKVLSKKVIELINDISDMNLDTENTSPERIRLEDNRLENLRRDLNRLLKPYTLQKATGADFREAILNYLFGDVRRQNLVKKKMDEFVQYINKEFLKLPLDGNKQLIENILGTHGDINTIKTEMSYYPLERVEITKEGRYRKTFNYQSITVDVFPRMAKFRGLQSVREF